MNAVEYRRLADRFRPTDRATLRSALVELRARGLTDRDIGEATRLHLVAVRSLLGEPLCLRQTSQGRR